jgi:hypothetical protein
VSGFQRAKTRWPTIRKPELKKMGFPIVPVFECPDFESPLSLVIE